MNVDDFCKMYKRDLKVVMRRMNTLFWDDYDALVIPTTLKDTAADKVRRALQSYNLGWSEHEIQRRYALEDGVAEAILELSDYEKNMFLTMDNYFYLNPEKIDLEQIFK